MPKKIALITGITGQDGSYLAELLLKKGYEVHGIVRRVAAQNQKQRYSRINHFKDQILLHAGDISNYSSLHDIIVDIQPDELYHLAAQTDVAESFKDPKTTYRINIGGTNNVLTVLEKRSPNCRFYFAATSEMFGDQLCPENGFDENDKFMPRSPYGISKDAGYHMTRIIRESGKHFACSGILFNHESPRRGIEFVTKKIINYAVDIYAKSLAYVAEPLNLGNLDSQRDWGYAPEYVEAMWLMLQQHTPDDYVVATGQLHTIREFVDKTFDRLGIKLRWLGKGIEEKGYDNENGNLLVKVNPNFFRPTDVTHLRGNASKASKLLHWKPTSNLDQLINIMIDEEMKNNR